MRPRGLVEGSTNNVTDHSGRDKEEICVQNKLHQIRFFKTETKGIKNMVIVQAIERYFLK